MSKKQNQFNALRGDNIVKGKKHETPKDEVKTIHIYDFDGTLFRTPDKEDGMQHYLKTTGKQWPFGGKWWSLKETLQDPFVITKGPAFSDFEVSKKDSSVLVILMTGRNTWCSSNVIKICSDHGAHPNMFIFKPDTVYDTAKFKIEVLKQILYDYSALTSLFMWDDREEHTILFQGLEDRFRKSNVKFGITLCDPDKDTCRLLPSLKDVMKIDTVVVSKTYLKNKKVPIDEKLTISKWDKEKKIEVCKFWKQGTCKFGDKCKNTHQ
jgi:hypothetical protein